LAVFAASLGISTELVIGPHQDSNAIASLRAACAAPLSGSPERSSHLQVTVSYDSNVNEQSAAALVVVVAVVDTSNPQVRNTMRTTTTLLGVSAGVASAEQLARVAGKAAADGRQITGILVADPEPTDRTTGRVPQLMSLAPHRLPTRLNGMVTETRR
jgi:hypothetical protein